MRNNNPLKQMIDVNFKHRINGLNTALPAVIENYDPIAQLATVRLAVSQNDASPLIVAVPVQQIGGGKWLIDIQIDKGDTGLVVFNKLSIAEWVIDGAEGTPSSPHTFDINDAMFIPGFRNEQGKYDADNKGISIRNHSGSVKLSLTDDGLELLGGDLTVEGVSFLDHVHPYIDGQGDPNVPVNSTTDKAQ
jgi:hypothetical protein